MTDEEERRPVLAWTIPPGVDPGQGIGREEQIVEIRRLADELKVVCQPESVTVEVVPAGISRIHLRFSDRDAAFRAFDAARSRVTAHRGIVCRIVASTGKA